MIWSVSACGCLCTAVSTATRGRVTRRAAPRSKRSTSNLVGTVRVWSHLLESVKSTGTCDESGTNWGRLRGQRLSVGHVGESWVPPVEVVGESVVEDPGAELSVSYTHLRAHET